MREKIEEVLIEFKKEIQILYGSRLKNVLLYGSWARGEAGEDSDIDVVVILKGDVTPGREIDRMIDIITEITLKYETVISVYPVSEKAYFSVRSPLLLTMHKEAKTMALFPNMVGLSSSPSRPALQRTSEESGPLQLT